MTDNRNRTASDMRHAFDKHGGNLGAQGSVSWSFDRKGVMLIPVEKLSEDKVMEDALEAGASDFGLSDHTDDDGDTIEAFEILTDADSFGNIRDALDVKGYKFATAQLEMVPQNYVELSEEDSLKLQKLLDMLEDNDDVQNVWHNCN
jgi:YebC/PmpR family DNA-binding regulatory protein